jgi:cytochrome c551
MRRAVSSLAVLLAAVALVAAGCGGDDGDEASPPPPPAETGMTETNGGAVDGAEVFASAGCGGCHAFEPAGSSGSVGPSLDGTSLSVEQIEEQVRNGGGGMPAFEDDLSDEEITAVAEYVASG